MLRDRNPISDDRGARKVNSTGVRFRTIGAPGTVAARRPPAAGCSGDDGAPAAAAMTVRRLQRRRRCGGPARPPPFGRARPVSCQKLLQAASVVESETDSDLRGLMDPFAAADSCSAAAPARTPTPLGSCPRPLQAAIGRKLGDSAAVKAAPQPWPLAVKAATTVRRMGAASASAATGRPAFRVG